MEAKEMAAKKSSTFDLSVKAEDVMYTNISTSKNGYNSATMAIKKGENEYMSISYEWSGDTIPGFAMDLMGFMKNQGQESSGVWEGKEEAYEAYSCKTCVKHNPEKSEDEDAEEDE
jgi:hypothetical protein